MERQLLNRIGAGTVTVQRIGPGRLARVGPMRLEHGLEVYCGRPAGAVHEYDGSCPHDYLVSFVNVQGFRAEMRLALSGGRLVVSELHVTPAGALPPGGITSRLLRYIPVHAHVQKVHRDDVEAVVPGTALEELLRAFDAPPPSPRATRGRRPVPEQTLLDVAAAYAQAIRADSAQPAHDAAKALGMPKARVRDYVHRARRRGFLTHTPHGRPGGELTPPARALLKAAARKTPRRRRSKR